MHLNSVPNVLKEGSNVNLNTSSDTHTIPPHHQVSVIPGGQHPIDRDISSFLDESHAPLDQSMVGIDHHEYMEDLPSTKSKRTQGKGKKKGRKGVAKP
jgi:hypothetical protein